MTTENPWDEFMEDTIPITMPPSITINGVEVDVGDALIYVPTVPWGIDQTPLPSNATVIRYENGRIYTESG